MRRIVVLGMALGLLLSAVAAPAAAKTTTLDGPNAIWLSDPERDAGDNGIEQNDSITGASGTATLNGNGATITVKTTGLEPGHTYTMWVAYFNDRTTCVGECNSPDLFGGAGGGVLYGDGKVVGGSGTATFSSRLNNGAGANAAGGPPPPFAGAVYQAGENNELHVVIRSHGPKIAGQVAAQTHTFGGGCSVNVGPAPPGTQGDFPTPLNAGECGDVQLFIFGQNG